MDISEIPVLTKVVHKAGVPATEMDELVAQIKQALLPEIAQLVASQLAEKNPDSFAAGQQSLTDYAKTLQQDLLAQAQSQVGDSIQSIEQAFREAMGNVGKQQLQAFEVQTTQLAETQQTTLADNIQQQLQAVEEKLAQLSEVQQQLLAATEQSVRDTAEKAGHQWLDEALSPLVEAQQAQLETRVQSLREQLEQGLAEHMQQLQAESQQALSAGQESAASTLVADYKQSLQQAFAELNALQMTEFKQGIQAELSASEPVLQEKIAAIVAVQLQDIEAEMNKRLKSRILEVLQGIKFVMPTI